MPEGGGRVIYRFDEFELDRDHYRLARGGDPLHIEPLALELLVYLIENRERLVSREELLDLLRRAGLRDERGALP